MRGRPERHVLAEDPVPDVVERQRGQPEAPCSPRAARRRAARASPARSAPRRGSRPRWSAMPDAEDAGGERREDPEQQRPVAGVAERARVAAVVDVVADVPQAAPHRGQQARRPRSRPAAPPSRARGRPQRGERAGALEHLRAPRAVRVHQPHHRAGAARSRRRRAPRAARPALRPLCSRRAPLNNINRLSCKACKRPHGRPWPRRRAERILDAAVQQAEDSAAPAFTIDDVARRVGVSRVTVYRYFPRKDQLVEAVLLRELRRFLRDVDAAVEPYDTLEERLVEGFVFALGCCASTAAQPPAADGAGADRARTSRWGRDRSSRPAASSSPASRARRPRRAGCRSPTRRSKGVSELLARAVLSFLLTPDSVLGMRTQAEVRAFAETTWRRR